MENEPLNPAADPAQMILASQRGAVASAIGSLDADPEAAARSIELSQATGVPAPVINSNLEGFEQQHKAALTANLLNNNEYLQRFINSNPMAAKVANDDYANLDQVSHQVSSMGLLEKTRRALDLSQYAFGDEDPLKRFKEGGPLGSWLSTEDLRNHPFASAVVAGLGTPIELLLRGVGGTIETGADEAANLATAVGGPKLGRDVGGIVETEGMGLSGRGHPLEPHMEAYRRAAPYLENGREPPHTALPEYDDYRVKQNADDVDLLKEATSAAQSSALRERSPELFKQFIDQHTEAEIGVSGEMVAKLYGDKLPEPDDNLLGWVPGIADKLALARETGGDVNISMGDWLAHAEPEVMQALHDDIRVRPGGITKNEADIAKEQAKANPVESLPELVPQTRAASALEPLFSVGDRKLKIERIGQESPYAGMDPREVASQLGLHWDDLSAYERQRYIDATGGKTPGLISGFHDFSINDEKGNPVGTINLSEQKSGKQLYVEMINGTGGLGPRDFGPSLMRDLLRQLKQEFPNAESITGHRVSGAREKAGSYMASSASPVVKLDNPDVGHFGQLLEGGHWETFSPHVQAYLKPFAERSVEDRRLIEAVTQELDRIAPKKLGLQEADSIRASNVAGQAPGATISPKGSYIQYREGYPMLLYALEGKDPLGTARHEAIHHLRNYGFFQPEEWAGLEKAVSDNRWIDRYNIESRYPNAKSELKREEAIADAYKEWENNRDFEVPPEVHTLFERMKQFFQALKDRIGQILGKEPSWEDIFQKVSTGEVGGREGTEPLDSRAFNEKLSVAEPPEGGSRVFERAAALGMTTDQFKAYDKLIQARHAEDVQAATRRATEEQAREQTKQWKEDRKALRVEVASDIKQRPDVAADLFFGSGELYGKKVPLGSVKMDASALTPEQKAGLPRNYYGEHGLHPDDVASLFGYGSGDAMVSRLVQYNQAKFTAGGMSAKDFVSRVTDIETDRQMRIKYGVLDDNIVDAVKEQVSGETQQDILHEETLKLGMEIGQAPLDKGSIIQGLKDAFAKMPVGSVSSDSYLRAAGKAGRQAELSLLEKDPQNAFKAKQQQYYATVIASEAAKFEKEVARSNKLMKRYTKPFDPRSGPVDAKYSLFNRNLLSKIDRPYGMSIQGMEDAIARSGFTDLGDFVTKQNQLYGIAGIDLPVADFLKDPSFHKSFDEMTVEEARETMQSVKTLDSFGRNVEKVNVAGAKQERRDLINQMNTQLENKFEPLDHGASKKVSTLRHYVAASTKPETFFGRFDDRDPDGLFTKTFVFPAFKASNNEATLQREFSKAYGDAGKIIDPKRKIDSPFFELDKNGKRTQQKVSGFTRENLAAVIANMGNDYNWRVFAKGWDLDPQALWKWVERVSKPEDFERAQAVGKLFNKGKKLSDNVYDNIYGVAPENIQVRPFTMHGKQYEGWYHPIIYDPIRSNLSKLQGVDPANGGKYQDFWPSTSNAYTKRRTGNVDVISLSHDMVPIKLNQMLHDIAYREFIHETAKITRDDSFRDTVTNRYGPEYVEQIDHWINSIAGASSYNTRALAAATSLSNRARQNVISTYIAFSPTTIEKHGLTAAKFSMQEVGHARFARTFAEVAADGFGRAVSDLFGKSPGLGDTLWQFAVKNSEELQRRDRNYKETFTGVQDSITGKSSLRNWIAEKGSKGVAFSDMLSAVPTWLARYREALEENGGDVGAATDQGDRAVRRAHGSTSIANRSMIESSKGPLAPWMTSIYGFFGTDLQRQMEIAHDVNDAWKLGKNGELKEGFSKIPDIASRVFTYVIWTGLVEEAVVSQFTDDHRGLLSKALSTTLGPLANTWVGLRDLAYGIEHGTDPDPGLMSSPLHDAARLVKDAKKPSPMGRQNAGKLVEDTITVIGDATGYGPKHIGAVIRYGMDVWSGQQKPKTAGDVYRGVVTGQQTLRKGK